MGTSSGGPDVTIAVHVEPTTGTAPEVEYTWDPDTDILSAQLRPPAVGEGMSGSVEVEGFDGSWLIIDVTAGRINGVEIAVWPDVRMLPTLLPPAIFEDGRVLIPVGRLGRDDAGLEVETPVVAEADTSERVIHFRLGRCRAARAIRVGRDLLLEIDGKNQIAGLWLLNVPPFPIAS